MEIRVCVGGATGWVGKSLVREIVKSADLKLVGAVARSYAGENLGTIIDLPAISMPISGRVDEALRTKADVYVDFTSADAVKGNVLCALVHHTPVVIGSSGLDEADYAEIEAFAQKQNTPVFAAGNYAITAVLLQRFAEAAAKYVPHWEIIDYGKAEKVDAPSGTARELAGRLSRVASPVLKHPVEKTVGARESRGATIEGSQVHSLRLPGFISSAEVIFGLPGERLSIRHDSTDSADPYVAGTLLAIRTVGRLTGLVRGLDKLMEV